MKQTENPACGEELALWGGLECTVNRVADEYFSQLERNGHHERISDLERFARLGISAIRYPVLWEHMAPKEADQIQDSLLRFLATADSFLDCARSEFANRQECGA